MGPSMAKPALEKKREEGQLTSTKIRWAVSSMQGWSRHMEDEFKVVENVATTVVHGDKLQLDGYSYFGVFDGHGGDKIAKACTEHLLNEIVKCILVKSEPPVQSPTNSWRITSLIWGTNPATPTKVAPNEDDIKEGLIKGYLSCDRYLCEHQSEIFQRDEQDEQDDAAKEPERSGSTAVTVLLSEKHIFIANCGDSRAVLLTSPDQIFGTMDHKPMLEAEKERIVAAGGIVLNKRVNGMLAVSRSLGDFDYKSEPEIDLEKQPVSPLPDVSVHERDGKKQMLILACDGVWDVMSNQDIVCYIHYLMRCRKGYSLQDICDNILDTCVYKGSRDNLTVILVVFDENPDLPSYDEKAAGLDAELDAKIEAEVEKLVKEDRSLDSVTSIMYALADLNIEGLPPGGGIHSKRPVVDNKFNALPRSEESGSEEFEERIEPQEATIPQEASEHQELDKDDKESVSVDLNNPNQPSDSSVELLQRKQWPISFSRQDPSSKLVEEEPVVMDSFSSTKKMVNLWESKLKADRDLRNPTNKRKDDQRNLQQPRRVFPPTKIEMDAMKDAKEQVEKRLLKTPESPKQVLSEPSAVVVKSFARKFEEYQQERQKKIYPTKIARASGQKTTVKINNHRPLSGLSKFQEGRKEGKKDKSVVRRPRSTALEKPDQPVTSPAYKHDVDGCGIFNSDNKLQSNDNFFEISAEPITTVNDELPVTFRQASILSRPNEDEAKQPDLLPHPVNRCYNEQSDLAATHPVNRETWLQVTYPVSPVKDQRIDKQEEAVTPPAYTRDAAGGARFNFDNEQQSNSNFLNISAHPVVTVDDEPHVTTYHQAPNNEEPVKLSALYLPRPVIYCHKKKPDLGITTFRAFDKGSSKAADNNDDDSLD